MEVRGDLPHVKQRGEEIREKRHNPGYRARRRVVGVSHSWFNCIRELPVRYEKPADSSLALLHMTTRIIAFRKIGTI